jgi:hypothetical protein
MNPYLIEEEILSIDTILEEIINKISNFKKNNENIFLTNNKIKELLDKLNSTLFVSKKLLNDTFNEIIMNNCLHNSHNYINDFIDIHLEMSQKIIYCKNCGIEKIQ